MQILNLSSPDKFVFMADKVIYLGLKVNKYWVSPVKEKINNIRAS